MIDSNKLKKIKSKAKHYKYKKPGYALQYKNPVEYRTQLGFD